MSKFVLVLATLVLAAGLSGQATNHSFTHYTAADGLSHELVNCVLKDDQGFMWFGTAAGLNRFDGRKFEVFRPVPGDNNSLPGLRITGLSKDRKGRIWISTTRGLCWYDPSLRIFQRLDNPLVSAEAEGLFLSEVAFDNYGIGWLIAGRRLIRLDPEARSIIPFPLPFQREMEGMVFVDSAGNYWVTSFLNLYRFFPETGTYRFYLGRDHADPDKQFDTGWLHEDSDGRLWCSTWGAGLFTYDPQADTFVDFPDGNQISTCMLYDRSPEGKAFLWIGGGADGLYIMSVPDGIVTRQEPNPYEAYSHNGTMVFDIFKDEENGIVWIATGQGIEKYDPHAIRFGRAHLPREKDFSQFNSITSFVKDREDPAGAVYWIGVWGAGLYRWHRPSNRFFLYGQDNGLPSDEVFDVIQDRKGRLWIALRGGVQMMDPKSGRRKFLEGFMTTPGINHKVLTLLEDSRGCIWIGSNYEGLFRYDPEKEVLDRIVYYSESPSEAGRTSRITRLMEDDRHRIWISTFNGIFIHDPRTGNSRRLQEGFPDHYIGEDLCMDASGMIWAATHAGLYQLTSEGQVHRSFLSHEVLPGSDIYRIRIDPSGGIWVGAEQGLFWLDKEGTVKGRFDKTDGLFSNTLHSGFDLMPDGELFIGTQYAFNYFHPEGIPINHLAPKPILTSVRIMNEDRSQDLHRKLLLKRGENVVSFEFTALNYSQSDKNRYAYLLEGFDKEWIEHPQPVATYTNLDGGAYTLLVKASNNDGKWSEEVLRVPFQVIPPVYKAWYFPFLMLGLAGIILAVIWQYRRVQQMEVEGIRRRIARDLHDDMGSTLSSIRFFSEYVATRLEGKNPEVKAVLDRISSSAATLSESMQDIIWTIDTRHDQLEDLVTRMRSFGSRLLEAKGVDFEVRVTKNFHATRLNISQRRNLYLIFKESVNNALKYSECSRVELFLTIHRHNLLMSIEDNGIGFEKESGSGNGLNNIRQRAEELGGTLEIFSEKGAGTRVVLKARLR